MKLRNTFPGATEKVPVLGSPLDIVSSGLERVRFLQIDTLTSRLPSSGHESNGRSSAKVIKGYDGAHIEVWRDPFADSAGEHVVIELTRDDTYGKLLGVSASVFGMDPDAYYDEWLQRSYGTFSNNHSMRLGEVVGNLRHAVRLLNPKDKK